MSVYLVVIVIIFALYVAYEIHKDRKRRGKRGIPFLGYIFDSVTLKVREEILDEQECSGASSKSKKKHKKDRKHYHKHQCSKKKDKHRSPNEKKANDPMNMEKNDNVLHLVPAAPIVVEPNTSAAKKKPE